jgi:hypothetical protein
MDLSRCRYNTSFLSHNNSFLIILMCIWKFYLNEENLYLKHKAFIFLFLVNTVNTLLTETNLNNS